MELYLAFRGMQPTAASTERVNGAIERHIHLRTAIAPATVEREVIIEATCRDFTRAQRSFFCAQVAVDFQLGGDVDESLVDWPTSVGGGGRVVVGRRVRD